MIAKWCLILAFVTGQLFATDANELTISDSVRVETLIAPSLVQPVKCDLDGNPIARLPGDPVVKLLPDGKHVVQFSLGSIPDFTTGRMLDYAPGPGSEIYLLAERISPETHAPEIYVVRFDGDGTYRSKFQLELPLRPRQIAVFGSGDLLLAGQEIPGRQATGTSAGGNARAFVGVFNARGQLMRRLQLRGDVEAKPSIGSNELGQAVRKLDRNYELAVGASSAQLGDDGKIYLMRRAPRGPVYAISPGGTVSVVRLVPPEGAELSDIKVFKQQLAAEYLRKQHRNEIESVILSIVDLRSRREVNRYTHSDFRIGAALACYSPGMFTFLTQDDDQHVVLLRAVPK